LAPARDGAAPVHTDGLRLTAFEVADGAGRPLMQGIDFLAAPGEAAHVSGESSTGKSTLVRVLGRLWPQARGELALPDTSQVMITPQKSYLPLGSLKGALLYPNPDLTVADDRLEAVLEKVGLGALAPRLGEVARWDQVLSNGERQRLAVARLLIHRPRVAILDEALSALDEATQQMLLSRLKSELPRTAIVTLSQRPASAGLHDRHLVLERRADGTAAMPMPGPALAGAT
jgi:putative ATP-binding cassette transporter